jgi:hypothetical protein
MARTPRGNAAEEKRFQDSVDEASAPAKGTPDYFFFNASSLYLVKVKQELAEREDETLPKGITMRQTEARHKRIHLLQLIVAKLEKVQKIWNGDPTPELPMTE